MGNLEEPDRHSFCRGSLCIMSRMRGVLTFMNLFTPREGTCSHRDYEASRARDYAGYVRLGFHSAL